MESSRSVFRPLGFERDHIVVGFEKKNILLTLKRPTKMYVKRKEFFSDMFHVAFQLHDSDKEMFLSLEKKILSTYPTPYGSESVIQNNHLFAYNMMLFNDDEWDDMENKIREQSTDDAEMIAKIILLDEDRRRVRKAQQDIWDQLQHQIAVLQKTFCKGDAAVELFPCGQDIIEYYEMSCFVIPTFCIYGAMLKSSFRPVHLAIALDSIQVMPSRQISSFLHACAMDDDYDGLYALVSRVHKNFM